MHPSPLSRLSLTRGNMAGRVVEWIFDFRGIKFAFLSGDSSYALGCFIHEDAEEEFRGKTSVYFSAGKRLL